MKNHGERAHSMFSASGAERWVNCPGSVQLSEGIPARDSIWSLEGTKAHEVLEHLIKSADDLSLLPTSYDPAVTPEMKAHGLNAAKFILNLHYETEDSELLVETRVYLKFIHPEMFGTFDGAVVDHFGTLHAFDYKYGAGVPVSPVKNLQMIFYGIGLADQYHWNFKRVRLWIIQPRIKGYDGPVYWEVTTAELKGYIELFRKGVEAALTKPKEYREGKWCHWCPAKRGCPLKRELRNEEAKKIFSPIPQMGKEKVFTNEEEMDFF